MKKASGWLTANLTRLKFTLPDDRLVSMVREICKVYLTKDKEALH